MKQKYQTLITRSTHALIAPIPEEIVIPLKAKQVKRVIVEVKGHRLHCAIQQSKAHGAYIYFGKRVSKSLGILEGMELEVTIEPDTTTYQASLPEELEAALSTDAEATEIFDSLTPGRQRSIIFMISKLKRSESRINKALFIIEQLKMGIRDVRQFGRK